MLSILDVPLRSQSIYIDLLKYGESSMRQLSVRLSLPRTSLYDQVKPLLTLGLVVEKDKGSKAVFAIHDLADLDRLVEEKARSLALLRTDFGKIKNSLRAQFTATAEPRIKFVEGKVGVLSLLNEMIFEVGSTLETVWPYQEMLKIFTPAELEDFNRKRIKQGVTLRSVWVGEVGGSKHLYRGGGDFKVERRIAPKKFASPMAYSIYGDKVSFFSSKSESYGFVVHSADFTKLMQMQFKALFELAKPTRD